MKFQAQCWTWILGAWKDNPDLNLLIFMNFFLKVHVVLVCFYVEAIYYIVVTLSLRIATYEGIL